MVRTPWGDATELRARMMRPGRGMPRDEAERNQRERLFAAMVATVAEKGYEATTVADLVELSGVSRSAFYRHFADKQECFLTAAEALIEPTLEVMEQRRDAPHPARSGCAQALEAFLKLIAAQPAASKMCFVEIYAAGPEGVAVVERTLDTFEKFGTRLFERDPRPRGDAVADGPGDDRRPAEGRPQAPLPRRRGRAGRAGPADLASGGSPTRRPRARCGRRARRGQEARPFEERQAVANPAERVLRALAATVAEKGYPATTVAEVVDRASTSQRTFYEHFANKEDALLAALDSGSAQMLATVLPAFRRAPSWEHSVKRRLRGDVRLRHRRARVHACSARSRCTRPANARCRPATRSWKGSRRCSRPGYELAPGDARDRRRGDRRRDLRADLRPGQGEGPGEHAGAGPDGDLHDPGAVPRRRGRLRARQRLPAEGRVSRLRSCRR